MSTSVYFEAHHKHTLTYPAVRESAFAKRRRLNDGTSAPTSDSDLPVAATTVKQAKAKSKKRSKQALLDSSTTLQNEDSRSVSGTAPDSPNENSFEPLASANEVNFSGSRETEPVDDNAIKVRLSKGQVSRPLCSPVNLMLTTTELLCSWRHQALGQRWFCFRLWRNLDGVSRCLYYVRSLVRYSSSCPSEIKNNGVSA